jgi:GntR family transcriptional regulator / MocR family aminotransferase
MKNASTTAQLYRGSLDLLDLGPDDGKPLHRRLYAGLRGLIYDGALPAGAALPSSRSLALQLGVSRNTVNAAYEQLTSEGYMSTRPGVCAVVADLSRGLSLPAARKCDGVLQLAGFSERGRLMMRQTNHSSVPGRASFHPGTPDVGRFPFTVWRRLLVRRMHAGGDDLWGYHNITGFPQLRSAIARYLRTSRGVRCDAGQVVVTTGAQASLDLLARLVLAPGDRVWMEEPGYLGAQSAFLAAGAELLPLRISEDGWLFERGPEASPRLIYLTPSCQFPLGTVMRMEQRMRVLDIARQHGAWIIEDDFDSEYRFRGQPIPAMQGVDDDERTIYVGTFSKTLFPALRIGFMVLPEPLGDAIRRAIGITGQFPPLSLQATLADFIEEGHFARHMSRMRRLYAQRLETFCAVCSDELGQWLRPLACHTGIQTTWLLNADLDDVELVAMATAGGVHVVSLSSHYRHGVGRPGLIMGYAALDERAMRSGLRRLRQVFMQVANGNAKGAVERR